MFTGEDPTRWVAAAIKLIRPKSRSVAQPIAGKDGHPSAVRRSGQRTDLQASKNRSALCATTFPPCTRPAMVLASLVVSPRAAGSSTISTWPCVCARNFGHTICIIRHASFLPFASRKSVREASKAMLGCPFSMRPPLESGGRTFASCLNPCAVLGAGTHTRGV